MKRKLDRHHNPTHTNRNSQWQLLSMASSGIQAPISRVNGLSINQAGTTIGCGPVGHFNWWNMTRVVFVVNVSTITNHQKVLDNRLYSHRLWVASKMGESCYNCHVITSTSKSDYHANNLLQSGMLWMLLTWRQCAQVAHAWGRFPNDLQGRTICGNYQ